MSRSFRVLAAAAALSGLASAAFATDWPITLNYNFNGLVHAGESGQADNLTGYRSISDRGLLVDGSSARFTAHGFGPGEMSWIVPVSSPNERWEARTGSHTVQSSLPDAQGKVRFVLPRGAEEGVAVVLSPSKLRPAIL